MSATLRFIVKDSAVSYLSESAVDSPERVEEFFRANVESDDDNEMQKEHLVLIALNSRLRPIGFNILSVGTISETSAHPREIMRAAIVANAYAFVLVHNHPSGDVSPSAADIRFTRKINEIAQLMEIPMADHVIVGNKGHFSGEPYYSFKEGAII